MSEDCPEDKAFEEGSSTNDPDSVPPPRIARDVIRGGAPGSSGPSTGERTPMGGPHRHHRLGIGGGADADGSDGDYSDGSSSQALDGEGDGATPDRDDGAAPEVDASMDLPPPPSGRGPGARFAEEERPIPGAHPVGGTLPPTPEAGGGAATEAGTATREDGGGGAPPIRSAVVGWVRHLARHSLLVEGPAVVVVSDSGSHPEPRGFLRRGTLLTVFLPVAVVIAAAVGISVGVTARKRKIDAVSAGNEPDASREFRALLRVVSAVSNEEALSNPTSPQFAALSWMANEDRMSPSPTEDANAVTQRYVMALLYFSTKGESWFGRHSESRMQLVNESFLCENRGFACWEDFEGIVMERSGGKPYLSKDFHECDWEWVGCYEGTDVVGAISMVGLNLGGEFPQEIGVLKLKYLHLCQNTRLMGGTLEPLRNFGGSIKEIALALNNLTGTIPDVFDSLPNLTHFSCDLNRLSGTIPKTLSGHKNLKRFTCGMNTLFGPGLNGTLPFDFSTLPSLEHLFLGYNNLSGPIPASIGDWPNAHYMSLNYNRITGTIPESISRLSGLKTLGLSNNHMTGTIPSGLFDLQELFGLMLSSNTLIGTIPVNVGNSSWMRWLFLDNNNLEGTIPPSIGDLRDLFVFGGHFNGLTGTIPPALGQIPSLMYLHLENNDLMGSLPETFEGAITLEELDVSNNNITGSMNFLCDLQDVPVMYADCAGEDAEVGCNCCLQCCSDKDEIAGCNRNVWTGSFGRSYCSIRSVGKPSYICNGNKPPALPRPL